MALAPTHPNATGICPYREMEACYVYIKEEQSAELCLRWPIMQFGCSCGRVGYKYQKDEGEKVILSSED